MTLQDYIDEIRLELTGDVLTLEVTDETLGKIVHKALREVQRYIDSTKVITVPFARCIDLNNCEWFTEHVSSITKIYRTEGYMNTGDKPRSGADLDPFQAQMWKVFSNNGCMYNLQDYILNYMSYNTLMQMRNTMSTDLTFKEVHTKDEHKLYINVSVEEPTSITIEYVPKFLEPDDIVSDYWIDIVQRLAIALTKVTLGRIRTRYKQSNALWEQDGDTMLAEGSEELNNIRETLRKNSLLFFPVD